MRFRQESGQLMSSASLPSESWRETLRNASYTHNSNTIVSAVKVSPWQTCSIELYFFHGKHLASKTIRIQLSTAVYHHILTHVVGWTGATQSERTRPVFETSAHDSKPGYLSWECDVPATAPQTKIQMIAILIPSQYIIHSLPTTRPT